MLRSKLFRFLESWWLAACLFAWWWFASAGSTNFYFPPLATILDVLWRDFVNGPLPGYLLFSLFNMAAGLFLAIALGVTAGLFIGRSPTLRRAFMPTINFLRAIPPAAIVPLFVVALGTGSAPKVLIIAIACFWPTLFNSIDGVRGISPQLVDTARAFRIPPTLYLWRVLLMAALPQIMAGVRVAVAVALVLMVISEFFGASAGLGFYINESKQRFAMVETWAGTLLVGVLGYVLSALFLSIERRLLSWYFQEQRTSRSTI